MHEFFCAVFSLLFSRYGCVSILSFREFVCAVTQFIVMTIMGGFGYRPRTSFLASVKPSVMRNLHRNKERMIFFLRSAEMINVRPSLYVSFGV